MKLMASRVRSCEGGFTIVSALIAVVLLSIAVVALSGTTVYMLSLQTEASTRSTAAGLAAGYMEVVKTRDTSTLASESAANVDELGAISASGKFIRELIVGPGPAPNSKFVTINVLYPRGRSTMGDVELVTIIYEGVGQ